jgi:hypothetical protein
VRHNRLRPPRRRFSFPRDDYDRFQRINHQFNQSLHAANTELRKCSTIRTPNEYRRGCESIRGISAVLKSLVESEENLLESVNERKLDCICVHFGVAFHWQCLLRQRREERQGFVTSRNLPTNDVQNTAIALVMDRCDYIQTVLVQRSRPETAVISQKLLQSISSLKRILLSQKEVFLDFAGFRMKAGDKTEILTFNMEPHCRICGKPIPGNISKLEVWDRLDEEQMARAREELIAQQMSHADEQLIIDQVEGQRQFQNVEIQG